jgi:hypothetical protein
VRASTRARGFPGFGLLSERHVEGTADKGLKLSSQAVGLLKSTAAIASAAVTAASAAAALVPFLISFGCLPAKVDSRNFVIERLVLLIYLMAMTSLATVEALEWLAGVSTRQTTAAT